MSKYIDAFSDTGFKALFGKQGQSEGILREFLNEVFRGQPDFEEIKDVRFLNSERTKESKRDKTIIHDIICTTDSGRQFIVEMQKANQENFVLRAIYYVARGVTDQAVRKPGEPLWTYKFMPISGVYMTAFKIGGMPQKLITHVGLSDLDTGELINSHIRFAFIQTPYFNKMEGECVTKFEKIIYTLKNMPSLLAIPFKEYEGDFFSRIEQAARYASLSKSEKKRYDMEMKREWDRASELETAMHEGEKKGLAKGRAEGVADTVKGMLKAGIQIDVISQITGLSKKHIETLRD